MARYWKSILAFVALLLTNELAAVANHPGAALPQGTGAWVTLLLTTAIGTAAVYFKGNFQTAVDVANALKALPVPVVHKLLQAYLPPAL